MYSAGFEPTHPKITELESVALDHSAKSTSLYHIFPVGVEPTIFRLEGGRLSHLATGTLIFYLLV